MTTIGAKRSEIQRASQKWRPSFACGVLPRVLEIGDWIGFSMNCSNQRLFDSQRCKRGFHEGHTLFQLYVDFRSLRFDSLHEIQCGSQLLYDDILGAMYSNRVLGLRNQRLDFVSVDQFPAGSCKQISHLIGTRDDFTWRQADFLNQSTSRRQERSSQYACIFRKDTINESLRKSAEIAGHVSQTSPVSCQQSQFENRLIWNASSLSFTRENKTSNAVCIELVGLCLSDTRTEFCPCLDGVDHSDLVATTLKLKVKRHPVRRKNIHKLANRAN